MSSPLAEEVNEYVSYLDNALMQLPPCPSNLKGELKVLEDLLKNKNERHTNLSREKLDFLLHKFSDMKWQIIFIKCMCGYGMRETDIKESEQSQVIRKQKEENRKLTELNRQQRGLIVFLGIFALLCFFNMVEANKSGKAGL